MSYQENAPEDIRGVIARAHEIQNLAETITRIANNLAEVGLDRPAKQLHGAADQIYELARGITPLVHEDLNESIRHGERMMGSMLGAILNGNLVPTPKNKD